MNQYLRYILLSIVLLNSNIIKSQVVINEILASNTSTNIENKTKNFHDWIEIYNYTNQQIDIGGWFLTDNKFNPTKWKIPFYFKIDPNEYQLFWSTKSDILSHTNFKLNSSKESVYLFNNDTILIDSLSFPQQIPDISYGRISGQPDKLVYFQKPTPQKENLSFGNEVLKFSKAPVFSHSAGNYNNTFKLKLTSLNNDSIYYTLDGTIPTKDSKQYNKPITIDKNTVVRARIISTDKLPGNIVTNTYFIKESFSLPILSLSTSPQFLRDNNIGIYAKGLNYIPDVWESANYFQEWERPLNIEYFDPDVKRKYNIAAGVRIHGRSTRNFTQKSLAIFTRKKYDTTNFSFNIFGERFKGEINSFLLRNGGNDWGLTMFLDGLIHTLVLENLNIDAQLYQPAIVFLNGEYWGIHNIREKINKNYIKANHRVEADVDIIEANSMNGELTASEGNMDAYNNMIQYIETHDLTNKEYYDSLKNWIDLDELIDYLITQIYIRNEDWPVSNMKLWREKSVGGKWRWILYDTELSFQNNLINNYNTLEHLFAKEPADIVNPPWSNFIFRELFNNNDFKNEFIQRTAICLETVFETKNVLRITDSLKNNLNPEIERHISKWGGIRQNAIPHLKTASTKAEWEANVNNIKKFIVVRPGKLRNELIQYFELKDTVNLKVRVNDNSAGKIALMDYKLKNGDFNGYVFADIPIRIEAIPNEGYRFIKWKGGDYENECELILTKDKKLTAIFEKIE